MSTEILILSSFVVFISYKDKVNIWKDIIVSVVNYIIIL